MLADAIRKVGGEDAAAEILRRYAADAKAQAPQSDARRPVVGERREPLFKGAATRGTVVPFELNFSPRVVEFVESVKQSGEFWPDAEKPTNGPRLKKSLEKTLRQAEKEGLTKSEAEETRQALLYENGLRNRKIALDALEKEGRALISLEKRAVHFKIKDTGNGAPATAQELPGGAEISGPCSVDLYGKDGQWKQRRWYDTSGAVEQDYDETHRPGIAHDFPHLHVWLKGDTPKDYKGKKTPRKRFEGSFAPDEKIVKNDKLDNR